MGRFLKSWYHHGGHSLNGLTNPFKIWTLSKYFKSSKQQNLNKFVIKGKINGGE